MEESERFNCDECGGDIEDEAQESNLEGQVSCPHCGHVNDFDAMPF